jgi:hypothetical protein
VPSSFAGQALTLNYLGGDRTLSSYITSAGTFEAVQVAGIVTLRRNVSEPTPTNNVTWNFINSSSGTAYLAGPFVGQESVAFGGLSLNLFVGTVTCLVIRETETAITTILSGPILFLRLVELW